jgi:hypothetical protein
MALDLSAQTKPTDGRLETQHAWPISATWELLTLPWQRELEYVVIRGNDGAFYYSYGVSEGGTPATTEAKVPQSSDERVWTRPPVIPRANRRQPPPALGVAGVGGAINATVFLKWRGDY